MEHTKSIKVNANLENGAALEPRFQRYATRLRALDKDGNGELDINEVCTALDQIVEQEKQNRLLKKLATIFGLLSLLTIAAVVGLTAAVIVLSQDTEANNNVLVSKDNGNPMATAQYLSKSPFYAIIDNPTPENLSKITSIVVPGPAGSGVNYTVHSVAASSLKNDGTVVFTFSNGEGMAYKVSADGTSLSMTPIAASSSTAGRKLLAETSANTNAIDKANSRADPILAQYCASLDAFTCDEKCGGCMISINPIPDKDGGIIYW